VVQRTLYLPNPLQSLNRAVTFDIATAHGTANAVDYTARSPDCTNYDAGKITYEFTVAVNGDTEAEQDETFTVNLSNIQGATPGSLSATGTILNDDKAPLTFIYTIQGSGAVSPLAGQMVTTQGIVVGDFQASNQLNGFFIQDASGDNNSATSDGIFVFVPAANTAFHGLDVEAGQLVEITGTVAEFKGAIRCSTRYSQQ
jgi:predicted extracellular nuclease